MFAVSLVPMRKTFLLRLEARLFDELRTWANQELRSVNAQIEYLLKSAVARRSQAQDEPTREPLGKPRREPPGKPRGKTRRGG
jgi:hypothetical protein